MSHGVRRWVAASRWPTVARSAHLNARLDLSTMLTTEASEVVTLPVRLRGSCSQEEVQAAAGRLRALYRCARVEVIPDRHRGDRVAVVIHTELLPPSRPWGPMHPADAVVPPSAAQLLPLGVDDHGRVVGVRLFDAETGGSSALIAGVPGSGKTTAVRVLLAGLAPTTAAIAVIDPTGGSESSLWSPRLSASVTSAEPEPTIDLLRSVLDLVAGRGPLVAAGAQVSLLTPVLLVCDELAELAAVGTAKQQEEARTLLRRITALGRKANVGVLLATQRTTSTSIDVTTRSLVAWRVALAHPDDPHGSEAVLGPSRYQAAQLASTDRGAAYVTAGGPPALARVFDLDRGAVPTLACQGRPLDFEQVRAWDSAALRELTHREGRDRCEGPHCPV